MVLNISTHESKKCGELGIKIKKNTSKYHKYMSDISKCHTEHLAFTCASGFNDSY